MRSREQGLSFEWQDLGMHFRVIFYGHIHGKKERKEEDDFDG